ncbi:MAG: translation initiation factor IF-2 [Minisyncoccia bacterium]|jgi:translation initiation factor IF-2
MASETATKNLKSRPPIVVVVGHVDHGKTTLLDYIRKTNVAAREAGGITQAVGAYEIVHAPAGAKEGNAPGGGAPSGVLRKITFIDTPGHEAFMAMRARGAQTADMAILVVAADEGVKPQTKESIKILEDAKTPFIVAFNKIDKVQGGNFEKAKTDLMNAGVMLEGYGGQISYHGVSAKTGEGVGELLDLVLLASDMEDLTYDPKAPASGYVLEARRDPQRGIEASVIVKNGTLHRGDPVATHTASGKVKMLEDFAGKSAASLEPSAPAVIIGFEELPKVGEEFAVGGPKEAASSAQRAVAATQIAKSKPNTLNLILKASDAGSLEALSAVLKSVDKQGGKEVNVVEESVGAVTDGDVRRAQATNATIIGFKNKVEKGARNLADAQSVMIITSEVVYDLVKAVEDFLAGKLGPAAAGELEVLAVFNQDKLDKQLLGGRVVNGIFREKASFEILRRGTAEVAPGKGADEKGAPVEGAPEGGASRDVPKAAVGTGRVLNLREKKSEITQAEKGKEIGVLANSQVLIKTGDMLVIHK